MKASQPLPLSTPTRETPDKPEKLGRHPHGLAVKTAIRAGKIRYFNPQPDPPGD
jgi:hypothetical protein